MFAVPGTYSLIPHPLFDEAWYTREYPDTADFGASAWVHFVRYGDREGRNPGPEFDAEFYRRTYLPLAGHRTARSLAHYTRYGRARGLQPRAIPRTFDESAAAMASALGGTTRPVLLIGNDAQRAGSPILLWELGDRLRRRGFEPVFLLARGGPLLEDYRRLGKTFICDEGWDLAGLGSTVSRDAMVIANTGWSAPVLEGLQLAQPTTLLIHEMPEYLAEHGLQHALGAAQNVVTSFSSIHDGVAAWIPSSTRQHLVVPGLFPGARSRSEHRAVARRLEAEFGANRVVYIGAGYADRRKGFDLFLAAAEEVHRRDRHAAFVWLGDLNEWADGLAAQAKARGLPLLLPGFRDFAAEWYEQADAFLLTSRSDPGPTTVMDAARVGVPFIGYTHDIGLRTFAEMLDGVGAFVESSEEFVTRALAIVETDTAAARVERAARVTRLSSFDAYVDAILAIAARTNEPSLVPPPAPSTTASPMTRRTQRSREASLDERVERRVDSLLARVLWRLGRMWDRRPKRLATVVVEDRSPSASESLGEFGETASSVKPGRVTWLAALGELPSVVHPSVVHLGRDEARSPWPILSTLQDARAVAVLSQFSLSAPPRWAIERQNPPGVRQDRTAPRIPTAVELGSAESHAVRRVAFDRPIGVFVHVFYVELAAELFSRIGLIEHDVQMYVSTDTEDKARLLRSLAPNAVVRVMPNRGQDIYPKLYGFRDAYDAHDIVLHVHGKRAPHAHALQGWLGHILDRLLPSTDGIHAILEAFSAAESLGMVSPAPFPLIAPSLGWSTNRPLAEALVWNAGWAPIPNNDALEFPAGSMFWARTEALQPLLDLNVPADVFLEKAGRRDGTVAHAIERLYGVSCETAGLLQVHVEAPGHGGAGVPVIPPSELEAHARRSRSRYSP